MWLVVVLSLWDTISIPLVIEYSVMKKDSNVNKIYYDYSVHAEVDAIMKLPKRVNYRKVSLYVVRDGMLMSKPCDKCTQLIETLGIKKVYYSCDGDVVRM